MKEYIGKRVLVYKSGFGSPIEVTILAVSDSGADTKIRYSNGEESWTFTNDLKVIDTLTQMDLHEKLNLDKKNPLNKEIKMLFS